MPNGPLNLRIKNNGSLLAPPATVCLYEEKRTLERPAFPRDSTVTRSRQQIKDVQDHADMSKEAEDKLPTGSDSEESSKDQEEQPAVAEGELLSIHADATSVDESCTIQEPPNDSVLETTPSNSMTPTEHIDQQGFCEHGVLVQCIEPHPAHREICYGTNSRQVLLIELEREDQVLVLLFFLCIMTVTLRGY